MTLEARIVGQDISTWFLVLGLFLPRVTLIAAYLTHSMPPNNVPFILDVRHEQTAGHMADAYFRVAHRPVATLTSCGPGSANLPIALACAFMDSSAFLAITGNVPTSQFNRAAFQET